ncbi:unnamed protein product [Penicillium salamii]|uniref:Nudix hydrolase domain-containing protein n=1 Tax=Penicillium salamii TaxID=1612424 RepID=A0A9W4JWH9_9EURO|nr:unnamed protein product [Penicillium salamii]CAG8333171.1 unnamed protein product [Penicillium salamii]CAG8359923.1 unnamed protein product [Penicillium salamii]CAG8371883.1 unnamed protein product [Penicillium salamii]CAG8412524.1 unnamed protein product [Penicillium salamii]
MDPRVGIAVFVLNAQGKFIVGKRKGSHGAGTWALPGGHLEFGESFETCAARETLEETGLETRDPRYLNATNSVFQAENKHYITIFIGAVCEEGAEPKLLEPEKCEKWEWVSWDELKTFGQAGSEFEGRELFLPVTSLFEQRPDFRV